jgi:hypothetical protein
MPCIDNEKAQIAAQFYVTEITAEGETIRVRVAVGILDARIDLEVVVETQNADIAPGHAEDKLTRAFEGAAKELRDRGLHLRP